MSVAYRNFEPEDCYRCDGEGCPTCDFTGELCYNCAETEEECQC